jgi:hypothetical protein
MNAIKHGHTSQRLDLIVGDNHEEHAQREEAWQQELNPSGSKVGAYLVGLAVTRSIQLDHCNVAYEARAARRVRLALRSLKNKRLKQVEKCERLMEKDPDVAVRQLKQTSEGLQWMIRQLEKFYKPLGYDGEISIFDRTFLYSWMRLKGDRYSIEQHGSPAVLESEVLAIDNYYKVRDRLAANEDPAQLCWQQRYNTHEEHQYDLNRIGVLTENAMKAREVLYNQLHKDIESLDRLKNELDLEDAAHVHEVIIAARFDPSESGRLLQRYKNEHERELFRCIKESRGLQNDSITPFVTPEETSQPDINQQVVSEELPQKSSPPKSRNEPNLWGRCEVQIPEIPLSEITPMSPWPGQNPNRRRTDQR